MLPISFQADHLTLPTKSVMPGLGVLHGPTVALFRIQSERFK